MACEILAKFIIGIYKREENTMNWIYEEERIYCNDESGNMIAEAILTTKKNGDIDIEHVFVASSLRGQGIADKLMEAVAEYLRKNRLKTTATCSYANIWLTRNRESYEDIISLDEIKIIACKIDGRH